MFWGFPGEINRSKTNGDVIFNVMSYFHDITSKNKSIQCSICWDIFVVYIMPWCLQKHCTEALFVVNETGMLSQCFVMFI